MATRAYSSITPPTIPTPAKEALSTAKHFATDVSSPTTMTFTYIYYDYTKSSSLEAIPIPPSSLHSAKPHLTHNTNYSNPKHH